MNIYRPYADLTTGQGGFAVIPTLVFPYEAWQKVRAYVLTCPVEINGFGVVDRIGDDFTLDDVLITNQVVSAGHANNDSGDVNQLMQDMLLHGVDPGRMRLQWHSHGFGSAYFSSTDLHNIERNNRADWVISLVLNKQGDYQARLDVFKPFL